jgi:hypothetical protein
MIKSNIKKISLNLICLNGQCLLQDFSVLKGQTNNLNLNNDISSQKIWNEKRVPLIIATDEQKLRSKSI